MELTNEPLDRLFAAWRSEIDSAPFSHEGECQKIVRTLLSAPGHDGIAERATCREAPS